MSYESLLPGTNYSEQIQELFYGYSEPYVHRFAGHAGEAAGQAASNFVSPAVSSTVQENAERFVKQVGEQLVKEAIWRLVEAGAKKLATKKGTTGAVGKVASRFVPYIGWALLAKDVYDVQDYVRKELI
jgi:hypothetical protein